MIQNIKMISVLVFLCAAFFANAQTQGKIYKGKVTDGKNEALTGVTVIVSGSNRGTITDLNGGFNVEARIGEKLQFSYIGFENKTITLDNQTTLSIQLTESDLSLAEIVVVGYGNVKKADLTGSVASVKASDLTKSATASVGNMLRGKAAGLNITQNSAKPGGGLNISIRGQKSPLIIIDGIMQSSFSKLSSNSIYDGGSNESKLIGLNPEDIESIDVLKDASSTAIYGADAAGGVIIITTKKGKMEANAKVDVSYSGSTSLQYLSDFPEFLTAKDFMIEQNKVFYEIDNSVGKLSKHSQDRIDNFVGKGTSWIDEVTRVGVVNDHNISVRSGTANSQYLASLSYFDNQGVAKNNSFNRITGRINLEQKFNNWLTAGINSSYASIKYQDVPLGDSRHEKSALIYSAMTFNPLVSVYDANGNFNENPDRPIYSNPVSLLDITDETVSKNLFANVYLNIKINKNLSVRATAGIDDKSVQTNQYIPRTTKAGAERNGIASKNNGVSQMLTANVVTNYSKKFADIHEFSLMAGSEYRKSLWDGTFLTASNFPTDGALWNNLQSNEQEKPYVSSYKGSSQYLSFFSRLNYTLQNKYILTANFRLDGSSNFGTDNQYAPFGGVSAGWKIAEEGFIKDNADWIDILKLRAGWGQVGNAGNLTGIYSYYSIWPGAYAFNGQMMNGANLAKIGNPDLKWQTVTDYNLGLDFGFAKNRISGSIDVYQRIEDDIILSKPLMSYNQIKSIDFNSGEKWSTKGIDVVLNTVNISSKAFTWKTDINLSFYRTWTIERDKDFNPDIYQLTPERWGDIWAYKSVGLVGENESVSYMPTAKAGNIKYADIDGYVRDDAGNRMKDENGRYMYTGAPDGILDNADLYVAGNTTPIPFGFNNSLTYKNWDLNIYFYGSLNGFKRNELSEMSVAGITDMTYGLNALATVKNRWSPDNPSGTMPSVSNGTSGIGTAAGDFFYEKAWYARLDNISLGYTFKSKQKDAAKIRIFASARNMLVLTPYNGMDPETGNGIGAYPNQKTFVLGLNLNL